MSTYLVFNSHIIKEKKLTLCKPSWTIFEILNLKLIQKWPKFSERTLHNIINIYFFLVGRTSIENIIQLKWRATSS